MNVKDLFSAITKDERIPNGEILSITEDSRCAGAESLFVCIRGALADGHDYAKAAYEKGCRFFVAQTPLHLPEDAFVLLHSNTRAALALLACRFYRDPSHALRVIGITGTKGKTTTSQMLAHILNENNIPTGYIGTNGISYGDVQASTANTTPDALTLQQTLSDMKKSGIWAVVIEVSSQALMQHRVDGIRFDTLLFTNLFPDHIGVHEHPDFDHYKRCKKRLFEDFDAKKLLLNLDSSFAEEIKESTSIRQVFSASAKDPACDYYAKDIRLLLDGQVPSVGFDLICQNKKTTCHLPLIGKQNAYNALLAMACADLTFSIPPSCSADALSYISVAGRSEILPLPNGACVIIDYAHNGESLKQLLESLRAYRPKRLLCLFGSVGDRTQQRRHEMGRVAAQLCNFCFLTSDNPGREDPERILDEIAKAFAETNTPYCRIADRRDAITEALRQTKAGDMLVLAGKGHEAYQLVGSKKIPFSEKEIIEKLLESKLVTF